jgi:predicted Holliday junction resolvase-like endonuclease
MSTLDKIVNIVQGYKAKENAGSSSWISTIVVGVLALIAIAIYAYQALKAGKETAKLLHEKAVLEEDAHQAEVDERLAESEEEKVQALESVESLKEKIQELEDAALEFEAKRVVAHKLIEKISSWEDVDEIIR